MQNKSHQKMHTNLLIVTFCLMLTFLSACQSCQNSQVSRRTNVCGGISNFICPNDFYCDLGTNCGGTDRVGQCLWRPLDCPIETDEVCACNGKTYKNACVANALGETIVHQGACPSIASPSPSPDLKTEIVCGGPEAFVCPLGFYCDLGKECGGIKRKGFCVPYPKECDDKFNEVCGCDDKTYLNPCRANAQGITLKHNGACGSLEER